MRSTWIALLALLAVSCSGQQGNQSMSLSGNDEGGSEDGEVANGHVEDHTFVPEPNTGVCGLKLEGSSFEGVPPSFVAVWVKAARDICCIAGICPEEGPPSCECYGVTDPDEDGEITVGFAPGFVEGPQDGPEGGLVCHEISFVLFESPCEEPPGDEEPPPEEPPADG